MFKKTEESEWTRFSRALGNREQPREAEAAAESSVPDPADSQPTMVAPPTPVQAPPYQEPGESLLPEQSSETPPREPAAGIQAPAPVSPPPPPEPVTSPRPVAVSTADTMLQDDVPSEVEEGQTTIADGTVVEGSVRSRYSIRILGSVQGEIESQESVTIEPDATVNAKIIADSIVIMGVVNGELTCPNRIEITDTGRLIGGINGGILVMHDGAYFEGTLRMTARKGQRDSEVEAAGDAVHSSQEAALNESES